MKIFEYAFMQRASVVGILLTAIIPCIGLVIVCKRLPMTGDALSCTPLAGVAAGLPLGLNPVLIAAAACVVAATRIGAIRRKIPRFSEVSTTIIMSAGIGPAGALSGLIKDTANFSSFLFGSIVAISDGELYLIITVSMVVLLMFLLMYKELFYMSLDEQSARLVRVPVKTMNFLFTVLIAVAISAAAKTVEAPIISSMVVVPVAYAMQFGTSYRQTLILAVVLDILFVITDLLAVYYLGLKPGGTIVLVGILVLVLVFVGRRILR